jgi:hypothetical protein
MLIAILLATAGGSQEAALHHPSYQIKAGANCRTDYVRQVRHVKKHKHGKTVRVRQVWCVYKAPNTPPAPALTPTSTGVNANFESNLTMTWLDVSGSIYYGSGTQLVGQPITYTITDGTTGQTIGTFSGTSNAYATCTVVATLNYPQDTTETFTGQAVAPYSGCALGSVSLPAADTPLFSGAFGGTSTYAPSVSMQELF